MRYYPIFLDLSTQRCLVIGGGEVAERKVKSLLDAGGRVTVISPDLTSQLQTWAEEGKISVVARQYHVGDLEGFSLVFAATDDEEAQRCIAAEAREAESLVNVVDRPGLCSFIVPAVVNQGDLTIAISTSGASPAMAKRIRRELEEQFGEEYALALTLLSRVRASVGGDTLSLDERQSLFTALVESPLVEYLREGRMDLVDRLLQQIVGFQYTCASLGLPRSL